MDRNLVMQRAIAAGVQYQVMPNVDLSTSQRLMSTAIEYPCCYPLMGLHPTSVTEDYRDELDGIVGLFNTYKFYGIGEIGIDLYWDKTLINKQIEVFCFQLKLAKRLNLPVVIHVRAAFDEVFCALDSEIGNNLRGVFHCFSGTAEQYEHIREYKTFMVGIGGVLTYKNAGIDCLVRQMDLDKIILETDSPYLSPVPVRGKRNEPFNITYTASKLAGLLGIPTDELTKITSTNAINLFKLPITI